MPTANHKPEENSTLRTAGWAAATLAGLALLGLLVAPSLRLLWISLLVLAVAAVPQTLATIRFQARKERERHRR